MLYAISMLVGGGALVAWLIWEAIAAGPASTQPGPDERFGSAGRTAVSGALGFGLGGMSAAFAGWNAVVVFAAAIVGAALVVAGAALLADDRT